MLSCNLKPGREKPVRSGHPWIFNGAIGSIEGKGVPGELCHIFSSKGEFLGTGYYNSHSAISIRVLTREKEFSAEDIETRISRAVGARYGILSEQTDSCRLVNSEGDFLPGLIVDKFGKGLTIQILTAGMEMFRSDILKILEKTCSPSFIYERSDTDARKREGLSESSGLLKGEMPEQIILKENGLLFRADTAEGQKTGFFFDQRINRYLLSTYASGKLVCDCFSYSGAFTVYALSGGASLVHAVDISKNASVLGKENVSINGFDESKANFILADVFKYLRENNDYYDLIVLDPPKFAKHPGEVPRAARGYKDINLLAFKKLTTNGILFTFSCSNAIDPNLFRQIVFSAAADSGRQIQLLHVLSAGPDHPTNIAHKEGEYLKGLVLKIY
jgi:23S rRNA (cytosine1962-C5)-methyltransferase